MARGEPAGTGAVNSGRATDLPQPPNPETKGKLGPRAPGSRAPEGLNLAWLLPTALANFNPVSEPPMGTRILTLQLIFSLSAGG